MKKINVSKISSIVSELCIKANFRQRRDVQRALKAALKKETKNAAKSVLRILLENANIARLERRALCQDTGIVSVYVEIGQDVRLVGGSLQRAINDGVKHAYKEEFLRKSVVKSPLFRTNTHTNIPAVIHTEIVRGNKFKVSVMPKGFGSENKSKIKMLNPTAGEAEIVSFVCDVVRSAGPDGCPPYILGIGIGGTFDKSAILAKKALLLSVNKSNPIKYLRKLEQNILREVNTLEIGPMGLGGKTTCLGVNILEYPTHIAGLPVAVNVGCHVTRSASRVV